MRRTGGAKQRANDGEGRKFSQAGDTGSDENVTKFAVRCVAIFSRSVMVRFVLFAMNARRVFFV
jgi:hypothetical protein